MTLSSRTKNVLVDKINVIFAGIGRTNGTRMPKSERNDEGEAYELWLAQHVLSLATKRKEQAETAAVKAGVIIDKAKNPQEPGTKAVVYNGDVVSIYLEVRQPAVRVDVEALLEYLRYKHVSDKLLDEAREYASTKSKAAHVFSTFLITDGS